MYTKSNLPVFGESFYDARFDEISCRDFQYR